MKLEFLGVGEAFDPDNGNTSILVISKTKLLVDCGYAVPGNYFNKNLDPNFLDAIYLTHFHADHTFGLPALIIRLNEEGRTKPLVFIGQDGIERFLTDLFELAYPGFRPTLKYKIEFVENTTALTFGELQLSFAESSHTLRNFAVRIAVGEKAVGLSGDGAATPASVALFKDVSVLVHETFKCEEEIWGHGTIKSVLEFATAMPNLKTLALVHIQRDDRRKAFLPYLSKMPKQPFKIIVPEAGDIIE